MSNYRSHVVVVVVVRGCPRVTQHIPTCPPPHPSSLLPSHIVATGGGGGRDHCLRVLCVEERRPVDRGGVVWQHGGRQELPSLHGPPVPASLCVWSCVCVVCVCVGGLNAELVRDRSPPSFSLRLSPSRPPTLFTIFVGRTQPRVARTRFMWKWTDDSIECVNDLCTQPNR